MKMFPTEFEITDEIGELFAKFSAFDDESFVVDIKKQIVSPSDIREIADCLENALGLLKKGYKKKTVEEDDLLVFGDLTEDRSYDKQLRDSGWKFLRVNKQGRYVYRNELENQTHIAKGHVEFKKWLEGDI